MDSSGSRRDSRTDSVIFEKEERKVGDPDTSDDEADGEIVKADDNEFSDSDDDMSSKFGK